MNPEQIHQILRNGSTRQRKAFFATEQLAVFTILMNHDPCIAGTIPLGIDVKGSDIDIICFTRKLHVFMTVCESAFSNFRGYSLKEKVLAGENTVICNFTFLEERFEIFCQAVPVENQYGYRHFVVEHNFLKLGGDTACTAIRKLKRKGMKTEPAFARYFSLKGDPHQVLYDLNNADVGQMQTIIAGKY